MGDVPPSLGNLAEHYKCLAKKEAFEIKYTVCYPDNSNYKSRVSHSITLQYLYFLTKWLQTQSGTNKRQQLSDEMCVLFQIFSPAEQTATNNHRIKKHFPELHAEPLWKLKFVVLLLLVFSAELYKYKI